MEAILDILRPDSIGDFVIYFIFFLAVIVLFVTPEKNNMPNNLILAVMFFCVVDLLRGDTGATIPVEGFDNAGFGTMLIHVGMAVLPFLAAGTARIRDRKGRLMIPLAILLGVVGTLYAIGSFMRPALFYG